MTIFRWVIAVLCGALATGSLLAFLLYLTTDADVWARRARACRRWTWLALLLWFNVEIWGRVGYALLPGPA